MDVGLDNFVETRRQHLREVRLVLEKRPLSRAQARQRANDAIVSQLPGSVSVPGDLVLVRESDSTIHRRGLGGKPQHERWTGPWRVTNIIQKGLLVKVVIEGRNLRSRRVFPSGIKTFHVRPPNLRHPFADKFAQYVWPADCGLTAPSVAATPLYTLFARQEIVPESGSKKWEYRGRNQDGRESGWLPEIEIFGSFTRLQLDVFYAL